MLENNETAKQGRRLRGKWRVGKEPRGEAEGMLAEQPTGLLKNGFSLIEVLVASAVLIIALAIIIQVFFSGLYLGQVSGNSTKAINLAQAKIEEIIAKPYDEIIPESRQSIDGFFAREVQVQIIQEELKQVRVIVYWTQKDKERSETLATLIAQK